MTVNDYWQRMAMKQQDATNAMETETNLKATPSAQPDESKQVHAEIQRHKQGVADSLLRVGGK